MFENKLIERNTFLVLIPLLTTLLFSSEKDLMHGPIKLSFSGIYFGSMGQNKLLEFENPCRKAQSNRDNFHNSCECASPFLFLQFFVLFLCFIFLSPHYSVPLCAACAGIPRRLCISWSWPHDQMCVCAYWNLSCAWSVYLTIVSCQNAFLLKVKDLYEDVSSSFRSFFLSLTSHQTSFNMPYCLYYRIPGIRVSLWLCLLNRI